MAIIDVFEEPKKETGEHTAEARTYTRNFIVKTDDFTTDRSPQVLDANEHTGPETPEDTDRIPRLGEEMPGDSAATVRGRKATSREGDEEIWDVVIDYDSSSESDNEDPTNDEPEISFSFTQYTRPVITAFDVDDFDGFGDPLPPATPPVIGDTRFDPTVAVLASSKTPFNPPHVQEFGNLLISMRIKEDTFDPEDARFYKDTINDRQLTIASVLINKFEARVRNYGTSGSKQFKPLGGTFWIISIDLELNARTWVSQFLDLSFYRLNLAGNPILIRDDDEEEVVDPQLLDGLGNLKGAADPETYLPYYTYFPADFSAILVTLPTTI